MRKFTLRVVALVVLLLALPLLGVWLAGLPLARYREFPPHSLYVDHAPFSWMAFAGLAFAEVVVLLFVFRFQVSSFRFQASGFKFPRWGWLGLVAMAAAWTLAWTRFNWFAPLQSHTFTPLWLSYILVINALTFRRAGRCLLTHETGYLLRLFPASAAFWWFFEYLNRYVQNWTYHGVDAFSATEYFLFATLSFSTVLPAVLSTSECVQAYGLFVETGHPPSQGCGVTSAPSLPGLSRAKRAMLLFVSSTGLLLLGIFPNVLFPLVWLAPLGLAANFQSLEVFRRMFPTVGTFLRLSLAALVCGFFWEMWNYHSLAKWIYHVPFVGGLKIFEMPVLGYFGYLPFGLECGLIAACFSRARGPILRA